MFCDRETDIPTPIGQITFFETGEGMKVWVHDKGWMVYSREELSLIGNGDEGMGRDRVYSAFVMETDPNALRVTHKRYFSDVLSPQNKI